MVWAVPLSNMKLIPHSLTPKIDSYGIRGLVEFGRMVGEHSLGREALMKIRVERREGRMLG